VDLGIVLQVLVGVRRLRARDRWTRLQLEAHRAESLRRLRQHAYSRSPFYREFHRGLADRPLEELPVLTKTILMDRFDELVTDRAIHVSAVRAHAASAAEGQRFRGRYWVSTTAGSTGQPGLFVFDRAAWAAVLTSFARAHEWAGVPVGLTHRMRMASVASTTASHMSAQVGDSLRSWWMPALRLAASDPLESIVRRLNDWQPEMLVAYASIARILADGVDPFSWTPHGWGGKESVHDAEERGLASLLPARSPGGDGDDS
jgi:phenylacetate-coenzyme A ligase PaaK-like adenylate-forming protein